MNGQKRRKRKRIQCTYDHHQREYETYQLSCSCASFKPITTCIGNDDNKQNKNPHMLHEIERLFEMDSMGLELKI